MSDAAGGSEKEEGSTRKLVPQGDGPPAALTALDFVARLADSWDGKGETPLSIPERGALVSLASLTRQIALFEWHALSARERYELLIGARRAIELGRKVASIFGEGST